MKSGLKSLLKEVVIEQLKERYKKKYSDVVVDKEPNPDLVVYNHGLKIATVFVETEDSLTKQRAETWKASLKDGSRVIVLIPTNSKTNLTSILWDMNLMADISIGTYDLNINTPV
ncbi:MAG: hypothetical protein N3A62_02045 [Thermodesulfovibrionales bacterium]|nr:hypothetical protein [Thermodesulfovibrionales bacterium]